MYNMNREEVESLQEGEGKGGGRLSKEQDTWGVKSQLQLYSLCWLHVMVCAPYRNKVNTDFFSSLVLQLASSMSAQ